MNAPVTSQALTTAERRKIVVQDPIPVLDTARFEHMQRVATVMASMSLIPDALWIGKDENGNAVALPHERVVANCFLIVNQAVRWDMDPFAVAQCVSVIHGKLCYEGKLIAASLSSKLGAEMEYEFFGDGEAMSVVVGAAVDNVPIVDSEGRRKTISGTVAEWRTRGKDGKKTAWDAPGGFVRMLRYRGAREWARVYAPATMLGVYSPDEMEAASEERRAMRARDVTPATAVTYDGPPDPDEVSGGAASRTAASSKPAATEASDLALAESGRHEPGTVVWEDPPDPDQVEGGKVEKAETTAPAKDRKSTLLAEISQITTRADLDALARQDEFLKARNALSDAEQTEVMIAFGRRFGEFSTASAK